MSESVRETPLDRHQAADQFCWAVILRMHLGASAEEILRDSEVLNVMQTWANLASAEGVLHDDDPEGKLVSHAVPYLGESRPTENLHTAAEPPPEVSLSELDRLREERDRFEKAFTVERRVCSARTKMLNAAKDDNARLRETVTALTEALERTKAHAVEGQKDLDPQTMALFAGIESISDDALARLRPQTDVSGGESDD